MVVINKDSVVRIEANENPQQFIAADSQAQVCSRTIYATPAIVSAGVISSWVEAMILDSSLDDWMEFIAFTSNAQDVDVACGTTAGTENG